MAQIKHGSTPPDIETPDPWHTHTADEPRPQQAHAETINTGAVIGLGAIVFVILVVTVVAVYGYYTWYVTDLFDQQAARGWEAESVQFRLDQQDRLQRGYVWVDHEYVQLPIDEAARAVAREYTGGN